QGSAGSCRRIDDEQKIHVGARKIAARPALPDWAGADSNRLLNLKQGCSCASLRYQRGDYKSCSADFNLLYRRIYSARRPKFCAPTHRTHADSNRRYSRINSALRCYYYAKSLSFLGLADGSFFAKLHLWNPSGGPVYERNQNVD